LAQQLFKLNLDVIDASCVASVLFQNPVLNSPQDCLLIMARLRFPEYADEARKKAGAMLPAVIVQKLFRQNKAY